MLNYWHLKLDHPVRLYFDKNCFIQHDTVADLKLERIISEAAELGRFTSPCMESPPLMRLCMQLYNLFYGPKADFGPVSAHA